MPSLRLVLASFSRCSSSSARRGSPGLSPDPLSLPSAISTAATSSHSRSRNHLLHHYPPTNLHAFSHALVSLPFSLPLLSLSLCILPSSFPPCYPRASHTLAHPLSLTHSLSLARWGLRWPSRTCPKGATCTHSRARQRCTQPLTHILEKVSALVYLLYKVTAQRTFQNVCHTRQHPPHALYTAAAPPRA
jgi:hypothetical protein